MVSDSALPNRWAGLADYAAILLVIALCPVAQAAIYTVGAANTGCTHTNIQAALDAAEASIGADTVRITRSLSYTGQHLVVNTAQDLNIVGGFATCSSTVSDGQKSVVSAAGANHYKVFSLSNSAGTTIKLRLLRITGGNAGTGYGGGIYFSGGGTVELIETAVDSNLADYGGGIYFEGNSGQAKLIVSNDNLINGNTANISGGGIYLQHAEMTMTAAGSSILNNSAVNFGGGLRLYGSGTMATVSSDGYLNFAAIDSNQARYGGGVAVQGDESSTGYATFFLQGGARISYNFASERGGAIDLQPYLGVDFGNAQAVVNNGVIESNTAPQAAAVYVGHDSDLVGSTVGSSFSITGGSIIGNISADSSNNPTGGGIVVVSDSATTSIERSVLQYNVGGAVLRADQASDTTAVSLSHSLVTDNTLQRGVLEALTSGPINITGSTITGNTLSGSTVISVADDLNLQQSIIWQPGKQTAQVSGSRSIDDVIASELPSLAGGASVIYADPRFIDPAHADYHLQAASPAVDFTGVTNTTDMEGNAHNQDMALVPNRFGSGDVGAYELQGIGNLMLDPGFIVDLRLWDVVTPGVSAWASSGAASAGAVTISTTPVAISDLVGLTQCVHIPGPGSYQLNGFAQGGTAANNFVRDRPVLGWKLRTNPGIEACSGAVSSQGEVTFPSSPSFVASSTPGVIEVPAALWSRFSSIEVSLIVREGDLNPNGTTNGSFDGISLHAISAVSDLVFADSFE